MREFWNRYGLLVLMGIAFCTLLGFVFLGPPPPPRKPQVVTLTAEDRRFIVDAIVAAKKARGCP